jgi:hypothetical protein
MVGGMVAVDFARARATRPISSALRMMLPGVTLSMSPTDLRPVKQTWLQRFDGERQRLFGDVVDVTK